jgi:hypothetical protein
VKKLELKQRVALRWDKDRTGAIVSVGVEVSEVKFDDGAIRFIANDQLIKAKGKGGGDAA